MSQNEYLEIKVELKYMSKTLAKVEKVLEEFSWIIITQNAANKRMLELERTQKELLSKIRKLEDWQLKIITITTIIATIGSTIIWLVLKNLF